MCVRAYIFPRGREWRQGARSADRTEGRSTIQCCLVSRVRRVVVLCFPRDRDRDRAVLVIVLV